MNYLGIMVPINVPWGPLLKCMYMLEQIKFLWAMNFKLGLALLGDIFVNDFMTAKDQAVKRRVKVT